MRRPTSTISARSCSSWRLVILVRLRGCRGRSPFELPAAFLRTEIMRLASGSQRQFLPRGDEGTTHRIAHEFHRRPDRALALPCTASTFDDSVDHAPEGVGDQQEQDAEQQEADHWFVAGPPDG